MASKRPSSRAPVSLRRKATCSAASDRVKIGNPRNDVEQTPSVQGGGVGGGVGVGVGDGVGVGTIMGVGVGVGVGVGTGVGVGGGPLQIAKDSK